MRKNHRENKCGNFIGKRLKSLRGDMSQGDMAKRLDITQAYLCEIEKGKRTPSFDLLCSFAEKLNTSISFLVGEHKDGLLPDGCARNSLSSFEHGDDLTFELKNIISDDRNSVSIELLLVHVKDKLRRQEPPLQGHDKDAIVSLLGGCLDMLKNKDAVK